jgi:hypothetical protein
MAKQKKKTGGGVGPVCPQCGSRNTSGLVQSFWAAVTEEGDMVEEWSNLSSETQVGPERLCRDCDHEFEVD